MEAALPREHYVDPESFLRERDMLRGQWTCIGRLDELGLEHVGRVAVVDFYGESIVVTNDGSLHAHANVCRHRGSQILPADSSPCDLKALRCPYHSWTYALDGSLLHAPHTEDINPADFALTALSVASWGGWLWLAEDPSDALPEQLGEVPERVKRYPLAELVVGLRFTYEVQANWKVIAENYNECYHCGPVHPELCRLVPAFGGGGVDIPWEDGVPHREGAWTFTMSGTSDRAPFPDLDEHERVKHKGELIYPNLLLSLSAEHAASYVLVPLAANSTRVVCELLFAPGEAAKSTFNPADAGDLWDLVNLQDWTICESVQRGMSSRYFRGGWYAPMEDNSLDIRRWLRARLKD
ncbi:MAG: aromatic ring-hydroxylating dioxygenase subunit alpha [Candidatus Nanopelagicales bacterium]|nr:aromatic ring-hydroxylating dioxygenase subunit alpha [Candidatus Nanopelagicales bacterium]